MMILHNFSVETDCCNCCKDDPYVRIPQPIMDSINNGLRQKIRLQTLYQKEKQRKDIGYVQKIVQVVILADFHLVLLLLSNGKDP